MLKRPGCIFAFSLLLISIPDRIQAGALRSMWRIDLHELIDETDNGQQERARTVFAIRFSPDEKRLAVVVENYRSLSSQAWRSHLLILDIEHHQSGLRQFEIERGIEDAELGLTLPSWSHFAWTADSHAVVAGDQVIWLGTPTCSLTRGEERTTLSSSLATAPAPVLRFLLGDARCLPDAKWSLPADSTIMDLSLDRRIVVLSEPDSVSQDPVAREAVRVSGHSRNVVISDPSSGRVLHRWEMSQLANGALRFADRGRVICAGLRAIDSGKLPLRCMDVDTGRVLAEDSKLNAGAPLSSASGGTRIAASDYRYVKMRLADNDHSELVRRVIWDFKDQKEIAAWRPPLQLYDFGADHIRHDFYKFALSPEGTYLAEGGDGILQLYRVSTSLTDH